MTINISRNVTGIEALAFYPVKFNSYAIRNINDMNLHHNFC